MANGSGWQFTLRLAGQDGLELAVVAFTHTEQLSTPFTLDVAFASRYHDLDPADFLDRNMTLTVWHHGKPLRRMHGIVTEFGCGDSGHRRTFYRVVIRPPLWRLSLRHNSRIFQHVSPLAIIETLCRERGISDVAFMATREPETREYCVQYRESDLAFIERLAAEEGLCYFHDFLETGDDTDEEMPSPAHRLVFADAPQVLTHLGERTYHNRSGGTSPTRHIRKLEQLARVAPSSVTLKDYSFKRPGYAQLHEQVGDTLEIHGQSGVVDSEYEHYDYPGRYKHDASGQPFTRIRLESLRREALTASAESDLPELAPGYRFALTGHDAERLNRDWQVVEAVHHGSQPQALEEDAVGSDGMTTYHNELVLTPGDSAWRPEPNPKPRVDGPQVATVVGPEGEEIHTDPFGRVRVLFPWNREGTASAWLRVAQGWAGGGYGSIAIPRIGHEVIVSFLEGDPDQPLITGRTYHAVNTPPYPLPEYKTRTVLRTQTHQGEGFNELRFDDANGAEQIWLHAQKDLELLTHNDRTEEIGNDSFLSVHHDRISEIHSDDHLTVHGQRYAKIDGDDHLIINASRHEKIGRAQLIEAGQEIHHKAGMKVVIEAGAEITLNAGGSFLKLAPSGITLVGPSVRINSGGNPGTGSGQAAETPLLPGRAVAEEHNVLEGFTHEALLDTSPPKVPKVCEACWKKAIEEGQQAIPEDSA